MRIISIVFVSIFLIANVSYAKTLVKYHKNTGDIIQTNTVDEMPSDEILNDRFKSETTDVLLIDSEVDIATQRVDLNKKTIKNISQKELDDKAKEIKDKQDKLKIDKQSGIEKLRTVGNLTDEEVEALF